MFCQTLKLPIVAAVLFGFAGCSSLSGGTRDAFAPFVELSQPATVDNVIVGGTNPYATAVTHSLAQPNLVESGQVIGVIAVSQAAARQMIAEAVQAQCGMSGTMGPVTFMNGQWFSRVQCLPASPQY